MSERDGPIDVLLRPDRPRARGEGEPDYDGLRLKFRICEWKFIDIHVQCDSNKQLWRSSHLLPIIEHGSKYIPIHVSTCTPRRRIPHSIAIAPDAYCGRRGIHKLRCEIVVARMQQIGPLSV